MRENSLLIDQAFRAGLRRLPSGGRNAESGLIECYNCKVGPAGIEELIPLTNPLVGTPAGSWPKPQLFQTSGGLLVGGSTDIYYVNSDWSITSVLSGLVGTNPWFVADFGLYQLWTNGSELIARSDNDLFELQRMGYSVNTLCNFRGQLVAGGFTSDLSRVAWSEIGRVRLSDLVWADQEQNTAMGTAGSMPMKWQKGGAVWHVKPLGNGVMVYGSNGITALRAHSAPAVTFGVAWSVNFGIWSRLAVAGDEFEHYFIDDSGWFWKVSADFKPERIGYKEFFSALGTISMHFNEKLREVYISDGTTSYLYATGLSETYQRVSGLAHYNGELIGILSEATDESVLVVTDTFDMYNRGIKTIQGIDFAASSAGTLSAAVDYRFEKNASFNRGEWKELSSEGFVAPVQAGVELRVALKSDSLSDFELEAATVRWKQTDKRMIRGIYNVRDKTTQALT